MVATVVLVLLSWPWTAPTAVVADPIMWSGGITSSSAAIRVHIDGGTDTRYVATSTEQLSATGAVWQATLHGPGVAAAAVTGLSTDTQYFYAVASATSLVGKFRTLPQEGSAANFTVAFASCACTGYDSPVFDDIAALQPAMFLHMGDLHYANIDTNSVEVRNQSFYDVFASPTQVRCCEPPPRCFAVCQHAPNRLMMMTCSLVWLLAFDTPGRHVPLRASRLYVGRPRLWAQQLWRHLCWQGGCAHCLSAVCAALSSPGRHWQRATATSIYYWASQVPAHRP